MKIPGGYYIKARKIQNSEIRYCPPHIREIWDWLIKQANHKAQKSNGKIIERGQLWTTYGDILDGLSWKIGYRTQRYTKTQCETAMKFLRRGGMITTTKTTRGMIITIVNYNKYQDPKNYENRTENHNENRNLPQQHDTINKNVKNVKNEKNKEYSAEFLEFTSKYPGKINKAYAWECWQRKSKVRPALENILTAIDYQIEEKAQKKANGEWVSEWKLASTWINQQCWEDEVQIIKREKNTFLEGFDGN